jgi:IS4 transposase
MNRKFTWQGGIAVVETMMELFSNLSPVTVMYRGVLESCLSDERLDSVFESRSQRQYCRELTFAQCTNLMLDVVSKIRPSMNAAFQARRESIPVSVTSVYNKLNGTEPAVCEGLVRETAQTMACVIDALKGDVAGPLAGYDVRILDGNHLAGSDHRIEELRDHGAAALPGHSLVILDPQRQLIEDVVVCEDAHANQRILIPDVLKRVRPQQCWIGDTHFCTLGFLLGVCQREAYFVVRQHQQLQGRLLGQPKAVGSCDTGKLFEQPLQIESDDGQTLEIRRVTIVRDKPTQSGETEIHLLSNLPSKIRAKAIAQCYRDRWLIESAFQDVTTNLRCEINTLGYPRAALFGFCVALVLYNAFAVVKAAIHKATPGAEDSKLSTYALADEIAGMWRGLEVAVPDNHWKERFSGLLPRQLAQRLKQLARQVQLRRFTTYPWTAKGPRKEQTSGNRGNHRATYRVLAKRT